MKVINPDTGFLAYQKIFNNLQANNCALTVWQSMPDGARLVTEIRLNSFHMESMLLHFDNQQGFSFEAALPLYCYSEEGQIIFKTNVHEVREKVFSVAIPTEIRFLEDPDRNSIKGKVGLDLNSDVLRVKRLNLGLEENQGDFMKVKSMAQRTSRDQEYLKSEFNTTSLDEEDKLFADKRESPRARPKGEKWVKLRMPDSETVHRLKLFDLSQGGMGFITFDVQLFPKGSAVHVVGIDAHELDDPLIGTVMSHRALDATELDWKIGVKFEEGQD